MSDKKIISNARDVFVESVSLSSFRGALLPITISFKNRQGKPVSCIIFGDNGTGKSTILDAIEFCIQSRIARSASWESVQMPAIAHVGNQATSEARVKLSDGREVARSRSGGTPFAGGSVVGPPPLAEFRRAPMRLSRADITNFLDSKPDERGLLLRDYSLGAAVESFSDNSPNFARLGELESQRSQLKQERRTIAEKLSIIYEVNCDDILGDFEGFRVRHVQKGISLGKAKKSGFKVKLNIPKDIQQLLERFLDISSSIVPINGEVSKLKAELGYSQGNIALVDRIAIISESFGRISRWVTNAFNQISSAKFASSIEFIPQQASKISISIAVMLYSGDTVEPRRIFSEGNQDLLALLFFFGLAREAHVLGQPPVLLLDDVLQSVDNSIRTRLMDYVLNEFCGWQFIMTVHDRLWREQLRAAFRRADHDFAEREIRRWSFESGPIVESDPPDVLRDIESAIKAASPSSIVAVAGRTLEMACHSLSISMAVSVTRRVEDRYTLGDLWPPVAKNLRKLKVRPLAERLDSLNVLRNLLGAHYNEWAEQVALSEAEDFANAVIELVKACRCSICTHWVQVEKASCRCGAVTIERW